MASDIDRLSDAVDAAEAAFFAELAKRFPEIETGDVMPPNQHDWRRSNVAMVDHWFEMNKPTTPDPHVKPGPAARVVHDYLDKRMNAYYGNGDY